MTSLASNDELARKLASACSSWPDIQLEVGAFERYLKGIVPEALAAPQRLEELRLSEMALVCACLSHDAAAVALLRAAIENAVANLKFGQALGGSALQEVAERMLHALLFATPPKLARYDGHSSLHSWFSVIAARMALNLKRERRREVPLSQRGLATQIAHADQELACIRGLYAVEFKAAFEQALSDLDSRERSILRNYVLEGMTLEEIGAREKLHASSVSRLLASARRTLAKRTRRYMCERLRLTPEEVQSIIRQVLSTADASVRRMILEN